MELYGKVNVHVASLKDTHVLMPDAFNAIQTTHPPKFVG